MDLSFSSNAPILLDAVTCSGSEEHLIDCAHAGIGVHYCTPFDGEATVVCITGIKYTHGYLNSVACWFSKHVALCKELMQGVL